MVWEVKAVDDILLIRMAPDVADLAALGVLLFDRVTPRERDAALDEALAAAEAVLRAARLPESEQAAVRGMYRRFGLDPTKIRPSSEALLRRVRKGDALPRINILVDICNWCSVEFQLPYGLYDRGRIAGPVEFRRGRLGETYAGIRKDLVHVEGRPVLADEHGPFGNPTADSSRTMVTPVTTDVLVVAYAPHDGAVVRLGPALDTTAARLARFSGGLERARQILAPSW